MNKRPHDEERSDFIETIETVDAANRYIRKLEQEYQDELETACDDYNKLHKLHEYAEEEST